MYEILLVSAMTRGVMGGGWFAYQYYKQRKEQQYYAELKKQLIESALCLIALKGSIDLDMIKNACQSIPILKNNIPDTLNKILENIKPTQTHIETVQDCPFKFNSIAPMYSENQFSCPIKVNNPKKYEHFGPVRYEPLNHNKWKFYDEIPNNSDTMPVTCTNTSYDDYLKWKESLINNPPACKISIKDTQKPDDVQIVI